MKYLTPMGYTDSAQILHDGVLSGGYLASGLVLLAECVLLGFRQYNRKNIT